MLRNDERQILINMNGQVLKSQDSEGRWWTLRGKCHQCGKCCYNIGGKSGPCGYLKVETINNQKKYYCSLQVNTKGVGKPWGCSIWPRFVEEPLPTKCGFYWELEK
jgi:hypothetical protein